MDTGLVYALSDFAIGELVLVRNVNRKDTLWPVRSCPRCAAFSHLAFSGKQRQSHLWLWGCRL